jgi:hypothetical protein
VTVLAAVVAAWLGATVRRPGGVPVFRAGNNLYTSTGPYEACYDDLMAEDWMLAKD